ncbi:MAG TPA: 2-hydroxyacid dehydrogenase [Candidatus Acidoferrales bacterium]|nr:2-hydroxyacid dehydrogenase [Candidatus Acidoferrales bacterium]
MKILVAGDDLIPSRLFQKYLEPRLRGTIDRLDFELYDVGPNENFSRELGEVKECWGRSENLVERMHGVEVLVVNHAPVTASVIRASSELRVIGCSRSDPSNVNVDEATRMGVPVLYTPGRNALAVAEYTLALILALTRRIVEADRFVRGGNWKLDGHELLDSTLPELAGKTIGIVGFGEVGSRVGELASAFGMKILVHDPFVDGEKVRSMRGRLVELDTLMSESDVVTLHVRLPPSTKTRLIQKEQLVLMKNTAYLVNTSRSAAIDMSDLCEALRERRIAGLALDVFDREPIQMNDPLLQFDNLIITPHMAGMSNNVPIQSCEMIADGISEFLRGNRPKSIANPQTLAGLQKTD